jgi:hypothetical protein
VLRDPLAAVIELGEALVDLIEALALAMAEPPVALAAVEPGIGVAVPRNVGRLLRVVLRQRGETTKSARAATRKVRTKTSETPTTASRPPLFRRRGPAKRQAARLAMPCSKAA